MAYIITSFSIMKWWYVGHIYCEPSHLNCTTMRNVYILALSVLVRMLRKRFTPRDCRLEIAVLLRRYGLTAHDWQSGESESKLGEPV